MNLVFLNGSAQQRQWVQDAVDRCGYPTDKLLTIVQVAWQKLTNCSMPHTYMCTTVTDTTHQLIQIESWADDPTYPDLQGLPDPYQDLHEFYVDSFVHEIGHVAQGIQLYDTATQQAAAACFTYKGTGRRGTLADYGNAAWADRIPEAISEWFRLTFLPEPQIYWNRSNWDLSPADYITLMRMLIPNYWQYGTPVVVNATVIKDEEEGAVFTDDNGIEQVLGRRGWLDPQIDPLSGVPVIDAPDFGGGGGFPSTFMSQRYAPYLFGHGPAWLGFESAAGAFTGDTVCDQDGEDVTTYAHGNFGTIRMFAPEQNPGYYQSHFGKPGVDLGDMKSWSGWRVFRSAQVTFNYYRIAHASKEDGWHGWGVVQLAEVGQVVLDPSSEPVRYQRLGEGFHGEMASGYSGGDNDEAPWGSDLSVIRPGTSVGPWPDLTPVSPRGNGWYCGVSTMEELFFSCSDVLGNMQVWDGLDHVEVVLPQTPSAPAPGAPSGMGTSGSDTPGGHGSGLAGVAVQTTKSWETNPLVDLNRQYVFACSPDRIKDVIEICWPGFSDDVDTYSGVSIQPFFIFWPVKKITGGDPPPYPARFAGQAAAGTVTGGSVRSVDPAPLAGRRLHAVHRVGGSGRDQATPSDR